MARRYRGRATATAAIAALTAALAGPPAQANRLSISPAVIERPAVAGSAGSVRVANDTTQAVRVVVRARPWQQSRSGRATPHPRRTLSTVGVDAPSFTLRPGAARTVELTLRKRPASASLYGAVEVVARPQQRVKGVRVAYRFVTALRLNPLAARRRARVTTGRLRIAGRKRSRALVLAVRNRGNSADPVSGSIQLVGPRGSVRGSAASRRILPGRTVDLRLRRIHGLARGRYTARVVLRQHGRTVRSIKASVRVS